MKVLQGVRCSKHLSPLTPYGDGGVLDSLFASHIAVPCLRAGPLPPRTESTCQWWSCLSSWSSRPGLTPQAADLGWRAPPQWTTGWGLARSQRNTQTGRWRPCWRSSSRSRYSAGRTQEVSVGRQCHNHAPPCLRLQWHGTWISQPTPKLYAVENLRAFWNILIIHAVPQTQRLLLG